MILPPYPLLHSIFSRALSESLHEANRRTYPMTKKFRIAAVLAAHHADSMTVLRQSLTGPFISRVTLAAIDGM